MVIINDVIKENYNAGPKAPRDVTNILKSEYELKEIINYVNNDNSKIIYKVINRLKHNLLVAKLKRIDDKVIIQMPFSRTNTFTNFVKNNDVILFVHDLVGLRYQNENVERKELEVYLNSKKIIVHNKKMKDYLISKGVSENSIVELELFDYLCNEDDMNCGAKLSLNSVCYAGNLSKNKAPFLYELDMNRINFNFNLYGVGIDQNINERMIYKGKFLPEDLPNQFEGMYGLVWDGSLDSSDEDLCVKNYTKYNNPHKLSCYIAAGLPVIVWEKSAISDFVKENDIGYTINSLYEINKIFDSKDYEKKKNNVIKFQKRVREGFYAKRAIKKCL